MRHESEAERQEYNKDFMPEEDVWVTAEGEKIPIRKMTDSHLINAIRWLEKNEEAMRRLQLSLVTEMGMAFNRGEHAQDALDDRMDDLCNSEYDFLDDCTPYPYLVEEAERRGLL